jgi:hypothetical protein
MTEAQQILACLLRIEALLAKRMPRARAKRTTLPGLGLEATTSAVPMKEIIDAWSEVCPQLERPTMLTDGRRSQLRWLWSRYNKQQEPLECVKGFFELVAASDWLCGRGGEWKADLWWCIMPDHFAAIIEGRYSNQATRK